MWISELGWLYWKQSKQRGVFPEGHGQALSNSHLPVPRAETVTTPFISFPRVKSVTPNATYLASMTKWKNVHEKKAKKQTKMASKQRWIYNRILQVFLKYLLLCALHTEIIIKAVNSICFLYQGKLPHVWESGGLRSMEGISRGSPRTCSWLAFCLQGPLHFPTAVLECHPLPQLSSHHLALNSLLFGFGPSPPVRRLSKAPSILSVALTTFSRG